MYWQSRGRIEIEEPVGTLDAESGVIGIALAAGTIRVATDPGTRLEDDLTDDDGIDTPDDEDS